MGSKSSRAVSCGSENHDLMGMALSESERERESERDGGREGGREGEERELSAVNPFTGTHN